MQPLYQVADILRRNHHSLEQIVPNRWKRRTLYALAACRTAAMGGHIDQCSHASWVVSQILCKHYFKVICLHLSGNAK